MWTAKPWVYLAGDLYSGLIFLVINDDTDIIGALQALLVYEGPCLTGIG